MTKATAKSVLSQREKFKQAARDLECDDDEKRFADRLGKLVKQKPADDK